MDMSLQNKQSDCELSGNALHEEQLGSAQYIKRAVDACISSLVDEPIAEASANTSDNHGPDETEEIVTPEILNLDYRYVRLLGEGANGFTWLAKDRRTALDVAIKELKFVNDFKAFELFQREAEVLQSIQVDGVPRCHKNVTKDLTSYIIQDYIPYPSLESYLEKGEIFKEEEVFIILDKVSEILFALQTQYIPAIIHRDIKPGNILYRRGDESHDAKAWLIDFGAVDNAHKQSSGSTIAGTFGYMAPEQLQGEVSPRSDFYSLGATALHLLTGVFPYEIPTELFHLQFHPVIENKAPDTTKPMIELLDLLLASNAEDRPQNVKALRAAIKEAQKDASDYRVIGTSVVYELPDWYPATKIGWWFRKTRLGTRLHAMRYERKRNRYIKRQEEIIAKSLAMLEAQKAAEKEAKEREEEKARRELEKNGVECECRVRRVSVSPLGGSDVSLLEGLFTYDGFWYSAYVLAVNEKVRVYCSSVKASANEFKLNTFKVRFVKSSRMTSIPEQDIWLTPEFYTKFTGLAAEQHYKVPENKGIQVTAGRS